MMEIVRQGADPQQQAVQAECTRCHTVVKFMPVEATYHHARDQRDTDFYSIKCPVCPATIIAPVARGYNGPG
jgi:uncharacterized Fe-S center protein